MNIFEFLAPIEVQNIFLNIRNKLQHCGQEKKTFGFVECILIVK
jgi:hypothetical protein